MKILRYELKPHAEVGIVEMPRDAKLLYFGTQVMGRVGEERVFVWALVDPNAPLVCRRLEAYRTGHELPSLAGDRFVGSVQFKTHSHTLHIFDFGEAGLL